MHSKLPGSLFSNLGTARLNYTPACVIMSMADLKRKSRYSGV